MVQDYNLSTSKHCNKGTPDWTRADREQCKPQQQEPCWSARRHPPSRPGVEVEGPAYQGPVLFVDGGLRPTLLRPNARRIEKWTVPPRTCKSATELSSINASLLILLPYSVPAVTLEEPLAPLQVRPAHVPGVCTVPPTTSQPASRPLVSRSLAFKLALDLAHLES